MIRRVSFFFAFSSAISNSFAWGGTGLGHRLCYIHAGHSKTGTTAIQRRLHDPVSRAWLLERGYIYPSFQSNHWRLAAWVEDDPARWAAYMPKAAFTGASADQTAVESFKAEVARWPDHHFILSSEHFQIPSENGLRRLKALLDDHFDQCRIIIYVRHPLEFARSNLQHLIHLGQSTLEAGRQSPPILDFRKLLEKWCAVYGKESVCIVTYDTDRWKDIGLVADFLGEVSPELRGFPGNSLMENPSLSHCATLVANELAKIRPQLTGGRSGSYQQELTGLLLRLGGNRFVCSADIRSRVERETAAGQKWLQDEFGLLLETRGETMLEGPDCDPVFIVNLAKVIDDLICERCGLRDGKESSLPGSSAAKGGRLASRGLNKRVIRAIRRLRDTFW